MSAPVRHHPLTRLFHWITAGGVALMLAAGILMTNEFLAAASDPLYLLHKGLGSVLLFVILPARALWAGVRPALPMPRTVPERQRRIMWWVHATLYLLLVVMVISGYTRTVAGGYPVELLEALGVPPLLPVSSGLERWALLVHQVTAYLLVALVATHVGAALSDRWLDEGDLWRRMAPGGSRRSSSTP